MRISQSFVSCALLAAMICAAPAYSKGGKNESEESVGVTQAEAENYAKLVFREDINEGRITVQKAGALFKCANDRYAEKLAENTSLAFDLAEGASVLSERQEAGGKLSEAEKQKYGRAFKDMYKIQREAEDGCRKEQNVPDTVKRVFEDAVPKQKK